MRLSIHYSFLKILWLLVGVSSPLCSISLCVACSK